MWINWIAQGRGVSELLHLCSMSKYVFGLVWMLLSVLLCHRDVHAQRSQNYTDTVMLVSGPKAISSPFKKRKFEVSFDARQTLVGSQGAKLGGLRFGMEYRRIHRFGIGFFGLSEGVNLANLPSIDPTITDVVLNLNYVSLYYERVLFFNRKWEWFSTIHLGNGTISGAYRKLNDEQWHALPERTIRPLELSTCMYYNINWWVSIGGGGGYRYMRKTPPEARGIYNSPVGIIRLRIQLLKWMRGQFNPELRDIY